MVEIILVWRTKKNAEELNEHEFSNESSSEHCCCCCCSDSTQNAYFETGLYVSWTLCRYIIRGNFPTSVFIIYSMTVLRKQLLAKSLMLYIVWVFLRTIFTIPWNGHVKWLPEYDTEYETVDHWRPTNPKYSNSHYRFYLHDGIKKNVHFMEKYGDLKWNCLALKSLSIAQCENESCRSWSLDILLVSDCVGVLMEHKMRMLCIQTYKLDIHFTGECFRRISN